MPDADSNRKRSRSPSDSDQQKQHKRANTGAASTSDDSPANTATGSAFLPAATNEVTMKTEDNRDASSTPGQQSKSPTDANEGEATNSSEQSSSSSATAAPSATIHMRCLIVTQDASIIIGKGGSHVNEIRDKSGARVMVSESIPGNPERILNVSGPLDAVSKVGFQPYYIPPLQLTCITGFWFDCSPYQ